VPGVHELEIQRSSDGEPTGTTGGRAAARFGPELFINVPDT
jgi:hypothetical protein